MVIDIRRDYRSNNEIKTAQDEKDRMMQEFLAKGGKVEKLEPGIAIGASSMNYSGKLQYNAAEVKAQAQEHHKENTE